MTPYSELSAATKQSAPLDNLGRASRSIRCFLCGKSSDEVVLREGIFVSRRCECQMLYTDPHPEPGTVDYTIDSHPDEFYSVPARLRAGWMDRHCPRGRLLEVGCGNGHFLVAARRLGHEVMGLEPHSDRARHCREVHSLAINEAFLENHGLSKRHFDVVYHIDLLAHFVDPLAALRSMADLLRPGGVLCLEVGILGGLSSQWYRWVGQIGIKYHLWLYSDDALRRLFDKR